ncbi:hypothetical protein [Streptomyces sp. CT34]|nr:hypothetical protein [Streptomyces sp. CT34]
MLTAQLLRYDHELDLHWRMWTNYRKKVPRSRDLRPGRRAIPAK